MATDAPPADTVQVVQVVQVPAPGPDQAAAGGVAGATGQATTSTAGEFGSGEFGARLDFSAPKYQDLWAFISFYVHVALMIIICIICWSGVDGDGPAPTPAPTSNPTSSGQIVFNFNGNTYSYDDGDDDIYFNPELGGIFVTLIVAVVAGCGFGVLWLQCMKMFAEYIIKIMLFVCIGCFGAVAAFGAAEGATSILIIGLFFAAIMCLYTWCVWSRIPFSAACLAIASKIAQLYPGTIFISILTVVAVFIWFVIWEMTVIGYVVREAQEGKQASNLVLFLFLISLYWGVQTFRNVSHTTTCGVAATWYFNSGKLSNPSIGAFKRSMTTSFGSIAFGSLIIAILQAIKAVANSTKRSGCLACIAYLIICCLERWIRLFNKFAFAQVAIYGTGFIESARRTWDLVVRRGILAIITNDLSGLALFCGAMLGAVVAGVIAYLVAASFYPFLDELGNIDDIWNFIVVIVCCWVSLYLGYYSVVIILLVVASGVIAVFVCFSEDPMALSANRPEEFKLLTERSEGMNQIATSGAVVVVEEQQQQK